MLGWRNDSHATSLLSDFPEDADLIDHIQETVPEQRLTWDGRKGQWIPISYAFTFPQHAFDHGAVETEGRVAARPTASFSFPPSKRHSVMLDQGSPRLRVLPRAAVLAGRRPCHQTTVARSPLARRLIRATDVMETEGETEDEEASYDPVDPFTAEQRTVKSMPWLDDIDIEDFLSSAIDYQSDYQLNQVPMSEPVYPFLATKRRKSSPCTPSSPPPPLFRDDYGPIPYFKPSPTHS